MRRGEDFIKKEECKKFHFSPMSNAAWCDLNSKNDPLKLHGICQNPRCRWHKQFAFTPHFFHIEGNGSEKTMRKILKGSQKAWNLFLKPAVNTLAPVIGMAVGAKSRNPKVGQATTNILKSISEGKILSLTDMHGQGLRLKVMCF